MNLKKLFLYSTSLCLIISLFCLSILLYIKYLWPDADFLQISNTIKTLTFKDLQENIYPTDIFYGLIFFLIACPLCLFKTDNKRNIFAIILVLALISVLSGGITYLKYSHTKSSLYEEQYIKPNIQNTTFINPKRNIILIYLESFEQTFADKTIYEENLIPNLATLQNEHTHLSGYQSIFGANYSIAAMVASHCAIPLKSPSDNDIWKLQYFLPQAVCFPEILKNNGYQTKIVKAADIAFSDTDLFTTSHGYQSALGVKQLNSKYPETKDKKYQGTFNGLSDRTLFEYAKKELSEFDTSSPFMLTLFTLDTHTPEYFTDPACQQTFHDLRDTYKCTDKTVTDFINWLKESPYWKNTTVVVLGDHLLPSRLKTIKHPSHRRIFNLFLNLPPEKHLYKHASFSALDIAPTILESLNIELEDHSFGLGRSLLSDKPTLTETYGKNLSATLMQQSDMYQTFITPKQKRAVNFIPYIFNTTLTDKTSISYADAVRYVLGTPYIDTLNLLLPNTPQKTLHVKMDFIAMLNNKQYVTISANNQELLRVHKKKKLEQSIEFDIPSHFIKDNRLRLTFRNNNGNLTASQMGIALKKFTLTEK